MYVRWVRCREEKDRCSRYIGPVYNSERSRQLVGLLDGLDDGEKKALEHFCVVRCVALRYSNGMGWNGIELGEDVQLLGRCSLCFCYICMVTN